MSLLFYESDSDSSDDLDMKHFVPDDEPRGALLSNSNPSSKSKFDLPKPKRPHEAPPPPPPIEVISPTIAKVVLDASHEKPQEIEVDVAEFREHGTLFAENNAIVRDKAQYNRVGYDRAKSQLTYLADLDAQTRGEFEDQMKRGTRAKVAANKMYGW
jgi:hypothetical protein